jgi:translation initiation factor IF-2
MENNKQQNTENSTPRPPVVVVLGHVDHGKTSLLNAIRQLEFTGAKPGGAITQHIGAYQIAVPSGGQEKDGKKITFLDTPGHEAFSAMRGRGAKVADIAILVIDVMEGVQQQTKEAIAHIQSAKIPMIVAINKVDRPDAIPEKVKKELTREGVIVESLGGQVPSINLSAKTGKGIAELLEMISLIGEMENLSSDITKPAEGIIVESFLDSKKGPIATALVTEGILKSGDAIATFSSFGKIKNMENSQGVQIEKALASDPVVLMGFSQVPKAGEVFKVFTDMNQAETYSKQQIEKKQVVFNPELKEGQKVLNLVLKSDVVGSAEAIYEVLKELPQDKVVLNIVKSEVGEINESDVKMARSSGAVIFGFRVKISSVAKQIAEREKVRMMVFDIIYDLVEGVRKFMEKVLSPEDVRTDLGKLKILAVFLDEKNRQIIGGRVFYGEVKKGSMIEVQRNEEVVGKGKMINLQKNKKDADRVVKGEECGILYEGNVKIEIGDIIVFYTEARVKGEL